MVDDEGGRFIRGDDLDALNLDDQRVDAEDSIVELVNGLANAHDVETPGRIAGEFGLDPSCPLTEQLDRLSLAQKRAIVDRLATALDPAVARALERGDWIQVHAGSPGYRLVHKAIMRARAVAADPTLASDASHQKLVNQIRRAYDGEPYEDQTDATPFKDLLERGQVYARDDDWGEGAVWHPIADAEELALVRRLIGRETPEDIALLAKLRREAARDREAQDRRRRHSSAPAPDEPPPMGSRGLGEMGDAPRGPRPNAPEEGPR
jgi:hypothetical protein